MYQARFEREVCLECLKCVDACPNENLFENYGKPGQKPENVCQGCMYCVEACPTKAIQITYIPETNEKIWSNSRVGNIRYQAANGKSQILGCGTQNRPCGFDDLVFVPAQLDRKPLLDAEEVKTSIVIGESCKRPVTLETPILIGAMSFGALSKPAKIALARASTLAGSMANTGEGGMLPEERNEAKNLTVQYSSGRFGVSEEMLRSGDMIEIKIGQGAKPGLGGHLLKSKITPEIAKIRGLDGSNDCISPSCHPDINCVDDLIRTVNYLRKVSDGAPVAIKIAAGNIEKDLEFILAAEPDAVMIDGTEGGTGAAPGIATDHVGIPTLYAIERAAAYLKSHSGKKKVILGVGGGLRDAADFAKALALGADIVYIGTAALITMGCRLCRACPKGICPNGLATQDELLTNKFDIALNATRLANYLKASTYDLKMIARMVGKNDVANLDSTDLRALNGDVARATGVREVHTGNDIIRNWGDAGCAVSQG